jgi:EmrB/QacA subfamily drug resistance transporter
MPSHDGLSSGRRIAILAICCSSLFLVGLDATVVNVALPSIGRDLHTSVPGLQWTVDAYTLVLASLLMLAGSTGDRVGRRRIFQTGLVVFGLGSLLCSFATTSGELVAFRALQAVGGSMLNPVAMSIIANTFTEPRERAQAIGVWGAVVGLSMGMGPVVGGALVTSVGWRAVFWINVPIALTACVLTALYVPESRAPHPRRFDAVGQLLLIVVLGGLTFGIIEGPRLGWTSSQILGVFTVVAAALATFVWYEPRRTQPLLDLRFFHSAPFSGAVVTAISAFAAFSGFLFLNSLYLQEVRGLSALHAGLATLPMAGMTFLMAPLSGMLVGRRGARIPLVAAGVLMGASGLMLSGIDAHTSWAWIFLSYLLFGMGFGLVNPPITNSAVSGMPGSQSGVAAAVASTSRQVGSTLGVAVLGVLGASWLRSLAATGSSGPRTAWLVVAGCGAVVAALGVLTTTPSALESARRTAAGFDEGSVRASPVPAGAHRR